MKKVVLFFIMSVLAVCFAETRNYSDLRTVESLSTKPSNPSWLTIDGYDNTGWCFDEDKNSGWIEYDYLKETCISDITFSYILPAECSLEIYINNGMGNKLLPGSYINGPVEETRTFEIPKSERVIKSITVNVVKNSTINNCLPEIYEFSFNTDDSEEFGLLIPDSITEESRFYGRDEVVYSFDNDVTLKYVKSEEDLFHGKLIIEYWDGQKWNSFKRKLRYDDSYQGLQRFSPVEEITLNKIRFIMQDHLNNNRNIIDNIQFWGNSINHNKDEILLGSVPDSKGFKHYVIEDIETNHVDIRFISNNEDLDSIECILNGRNVKIPRVSKINNNSIFEGRFYTDEFLKFEKNLYLDISSNYNVEDIEILNSDDGRIHLFNELDDGLEKTTKVLSESEIIYLGTLCSLESIEIDSDIIPNLEIHTNNYFNEWLPVTGTSENDRYIITLNGQISDQIRLSYTEPYEISELEIKGSEVRKDFRRNSFYLKKEDYESYNFMQHPYLEDDAYFETTINSEYSVRGFAGFGRNRCYINDQEVELDHNGKFNKEISLENGYNDINVVIYDFSKRFIIEKFNKKIYSYTSDLALVLDSPSDDIQTNTNTYTISGRVGNGEEIEVFINDENINLKKNKFEYVTKLTEGLQIFKIVARDKFGRSTERDVSICLDTTAPNITVNSPIEGSYYNAETLPVSIDTNSDECFWWRIKDNTEWEFCSISELQKNLFVDEGFHSWQFEIMDEVGNITTSETFTFCVDRTIPNNFNLTSNIEGWSNNKTPEISFSAEDHISGIDFYELSIDSSIFSVVESPYTFEALDNGIHKVIVRAYDKAGNYASDELELKIDLTNPGIPENLKLIPGTDNIQIFWTSVDDGEGYQKIYAERRKNSSSDTALIEITETTKYGDGNFRDSYLEKNETYSYRIYAEDRAGNLSGFTDWLDATTGISSVNIVKNTETIIEYDGIEVKIPKESFCQDINRISITEVSSDEVDYETIHPMSKYYRINGWTIKDGNEEKVEHVELLNAASIICEINENLLPEGYSYGDVYASWYDTLWERWVVLKDSYLSRDENHIVFETPHFTDFNVQATKITDVTPQALREELTEFNHTEVKHEEFTVSPETGIVTTSFTEKVLPGKNGLDFIIKRNYSSSTAYQAASKRADINEMSSSEKKKDSRNLDGSSAWKIADGWRINVPFMKSSTDDIWVTDCNGNLVSISQMTHKGNGSIEFENHEGSDFTFVAQVGMKAAEVHASNGKIIKYDSKGRVVLITDDNGNESNAIKFTYENQIFEYENEIYNAQNIVTDTMNRQVRFLIKDGCIVKIILSIDQNDETISSYTVHGINDNTTADKDSNKNPVLVSALDPIGRKWNYTYEDKESTSDYKIYEKDTSFSYRRKTLRNITTSLLTSIECPGFGYKTMNYTENFRSYDDHKVGECYRVSYTDFTGNEEKIYLNNSDTKPLRTNKYSFSVNFDEYHTFYVENAEIKHYIDEIYSKGEKYYFDAKTKSRNLYNRGEIRTGNDLECYINKYTVFNLKETIPALSKIEFYDDSNSLIKSEYNEFDNNSLRLLCKKTYFSDDNYTCTTYKYDSWGNKTEELNESCVLGRKTKKLISNYYYGNNGSNIPDNITIPKNFIEFTNKSTNANRHNYLSLTKVDKYYWYEESFEDKDAVIVSEIAGFDYNKNGQIDRKISKVTDDKWICTHYEYNDFGEIKLIEECPENEIDNKRITEINYNYSDKDKYSIETVKENILLGIGHKKDISVKKIYYLNGKKSSEIDGNGNTTLYEYDEIGRITTKIDPATHIQKITYGDNKENLSTILTNAKNIETKYSYDNLGRLIKVEKDLENENSIIIELVNDSADCVTSMTGPYYKSQTEEKPETIYSYDSQNRLISTTKPGHKCKIEETYETVYNRVTTRDEEGRLIRETKDYNGKVIFKEYFTGGKWISSENRYDSDGIIYYKKDYNGTVENYYINSIGKINRIFYTYNDEPIKISSKTDYDYSSFGYVIKETIRDQEDNVIGLSENTEINALGQILETKLYPKIENNEPKTYPDDEIENDKTQCKRFEYDANGNKTKELSLKENNIKQNEYITESWVYDELNRITKFSDAENNIEVTEYDELGNKKNVTDAEGHKLVLEYDNFNRIETAILPKLKGMADDFDYKKSFIYDAVGNCIKLIDVDGTITETKYRLDNLPEYVTIKSEGKEYKTKNEYDNSGLITKITDQNSKVTEKKYDEASRVIMEGNSEGYTTYTYDVNGNILTKKDKLGNETIYSYDYFNNVSKVTDAFNNSMQYEYDEKQCLTKKTDFNNNIVTIKYDALKRPITKIWNRKNQAGTDVTESHAYDLLGNEYSFTNRNGILFTRKYTNTGLLSEETAESSKEKGIVLGIREYNYDKIGNLESLFETVEGETSVINYNTENGKHFSDAYGLIYSREINSLKTKYNYNSARKLTSITTPDGKSVEYNINGLGEITGVKGWTDEISYNDGNLLKEIEFVNSSRKTFEYDEQSRLCKLSYENSDGIILDSYHMEYDAENNLIGMNNNSYKYDKLNRLENTTEKDGHYFVEDNIDTNIGEALKDFDGSKDIETILSGEEEVIFDCGAKSVITDLGESYEINKVIISPELAVNRVLTTDVSLYVKNSDEEWEKVTAVKIKKDINTGIITILTGKYIKTRYIKIQCRLDDRTFDNNIEKKFSNFKNKSKNLITVSAHRSYLYENYCYDNNSNRNSLTRNGKTYNLEYYKNNENGNTSLLKDDGRFVYCYDDNGNRISKTKKNNTLDESPEEWIYKWDIYNRLVSVVNNKGIEVSYSYDGENYKTSRITKDKKDYYVYSKNGYLLWEENENLIENSVKQRRYIYYGTSLIGIEENDERYYIVTNFQGSVTEITDNNGSQVWKGTYDPYGRLCGKIGYFDFSGIYTGKEIDSDTGLTYHLNRWRNEDGDSFISEDPAEDGYNWYIYALCNPFKFSDPDGLKTNASGEFNDGAPIPGTNQPWGTGGPSWSTYSSCDINNYTDTGKRENDIEAAKKGDKIRNDPVKSEELKSKYKTQVEKKITKICKKLKVVDSSIEDTTEQNKEDTTEQNKEDTTELDVELKKQNELEKKFGYGNILCLVTTIVNMYISDRVITIDFIDCKLGGIIKANLDVNNNVKDFNVFSMSLAKAANLSKYYSYVYPKGNQLFLSRKDFFQSEYKYAVGNYFNLDRKIDPNTKYTNGFDHYELFRNAPFMDVINPGIGKGEGSYNFYNVAPVSLYTIK